jgi:hypothetical protein
VLLQLPGITQDSAASGNLHVRNEHANVSYRINGILLPDGLGAFGQYLDSSWVGSLSLITGALPAQYGLRTAGIVDITTAKFDNSGEIGTYMGSRHTSNSNIPIRRYGRQHRIFLQRPVSADRPRYREPVSGAQRAARSQHAG